MLYNLSAHEDRIKLIQNINSDNNKARKQDSLKSSEVQGGRLQQYVKDYLLTQLNSSTVKEMPLVTTINIQDAIVCKKATIYKRKPSRYFTNLNTNQTQVVNKIYKDMKLDEKLNISNKNYCYQDQSIGMIVPKDGKLICRIFKMHQIDAIPSLNDPETSDGYIISAFDRTDYIQMDSSKIERDTATGYTGKGDKSTAQDINVDIAEKYQFKKYVEKYLVWTKEYNFMMNGLGEVIDPSTGEASNDVDTESPLKDFNIMPFFEIARDKDFEYFVRSSNNLTDFTIQFNAMLSDLATNCKMNGYSVGVLKAPSELQPQHQVVGASMLLKLPTDNPDSEVDFSFVSPNSNIGEISQAIDRLLNYYVTSKGVGSGVVNSTGDIEKASSGIDRYLMMLSKTEANQDDFDAYLNAEHAIYEIIKAWLSVLSNSDQLNDEYKTSIPDNSFIEVEYYKPEMIETDTEKLSSIEKRIDLGLINQEMAVSEYYGIKDVDKLNELMSKLKPEVNIG